MRRSLETAIGLGRTVALLYGLLFPVFLASAYRQEDPGGVSTFILLLTFLPAIVLSRLASAAWSTCVGRWGSKSIVERLQTYQPFSWPEYLREVLVGSVFGTIAFHAFALVPHIGKEWPLWLSLLMGILLAFGHGSMRFSRKRAGLRYPKGFPIRPLSLDAEDTTEVLESFLRVMMRLAPSAAFFGALFLLIIWIIQPRGGILPGASRLERYAVAAGFLLVAWSARWLCRRALIALAKQRTPEIVLAKRTFAIEEYLSEAVIGISFIWTLAIGMTRLMPLSDARTALLVTTVLLAVPVALLSAARSYFRPDAKGPTHS